jgi:hypothetical protein
MDIQEKLTEIGNYFKTKLINGDYEFISSNKYTAKLLFEKGIKLDVWIGNGEKHLQFYNAFIITNEFMRLKNINDIKKAWEVLSPKINEFKIKLNREEKMQLLEKLKKELKI